MDTKFNGADASDGTPAPLPAFDDQPTDRRAVRALVAGAAGIAVLAGAAVGFVWLSSAPQADASALSVPGAIATPDVTSTPSTGTSAFGFTGRDIFDNTIAPKVGVGASDSVDGVAVGGSTSAATSAATSGAAGTGGGGSKGSSGSGSVTTTAPSTTVPSTPAPTSPSTPTPSRSTAAPWQKADVKFVELSKDGSLGRFLVGGDTTAYLASNSVIPGTSTVFTSKASSTTRDMTAEEKTACNAFLQDPTKSLAEKAAKNTDTADCTTITETVVKAVFTTDASLRSGWVVNPDSQLPDAAVGRTSGTVRVLGQRGTQFLVQVDRNPAVWLSAGSAVEGTPLTFVGLGSDELQRGDIAVFSEADSRYFTVLGGGEKSGISF